MKFVKYGNGGRLGVIQDERILDISRAAKAMQGRYGISAESVHDMFGSLLVLIESGSRGLDAVRNLMESCKASDLPGLYSPLEGQILHAPFPGRRFGLAGSNNAEHVANAMVNIGKPITPEAYREKTRRGKAGGFWVIDPPVGPGAKIPYPESSGGLFDYEAEVGIVLAKGGKKVKSDDWMSRVWGVTLVIDWSIRNHDLLANRQPFYAHKIFDNSKSLGPWIAVDEVDPTSCDVELRVNSELRQSFNNNGMIHTYGEMLEQISQELTLNPGDILSGGTGPGTAADRTIPRSDGTLPADLFLKPGDRVEVSSPNLGVLDGQVVSAI